MCIRDRFGAFGTRGAMSPQHTPGLANHALKPQAIARRRAFRKATDRFALDRRQRVSTHVCRARSRTRTRDSLLYAVRWVSGGSARSHLRRRGASLRLAAHHVRAHPAIRQPAPARACPTPSAGVTLARANCPPLLCWAPCPPPPPYSDRQRRLPARRHNALKPQPIARSTTVRQTTPLFETPAPP